MESCFCPECGQEMNHEFRISICGLFKPSSDGSSESIKYAFLNDGVQLDMEKVSECKELKEIQNMLKNETDDDDDDDDDMFGLDMEDGTEFMNILQEANAEILENMFNFKMDISNPLDENCIKYVWVSLLIKKIQEATNHNNRIVQYLLSVERPALNKDPHDDGSKDCWYNVNLKECFDDSKLKKVLVVLMPIFNMDFLSEEISVAREIINMVQTATTCQLEFISEWIHTSYKQGKDGKYYLNSFSYNNANAFLRICPVCGVHISKNLGLYKQKIVSFIGTPTSGKSTLINAIHTKIHRGGQQLSGIDCIFEMSDPYYNQYTESYQNATLKKLATQKTTRDEFPSLTVLLKCDNEEIVYTFVDVPGEYFIAKNIAHAMNNIDLSHLNIMKHSDFICIVLAGEQLNLKMLENKPHIMATMKTDDMETFLARVTVFRNNILHDKDIPVCFVITKADAIEPTEHDFTKENDVPKWTPNGKLTNITLDDVNRLYGNLKNTDNIVLETNNSHIVSADKLMNLQNQVHSFIGAEVNAKVLMDGLTTNICSYKWENIPTFMVSPFGFYALQNVWNMSIDEKLEAFKNRNFTKDNIDPKNFDVLAKADVTQFNNDIPTDVTPDNPIQFAQMQCGLSKDDIEHIFSNWYTIIHHEHNSFGIEYLLYWIFIYTGLMNYVCDVNNINNDNVIGENKNNREQFKHCIGIHDSFQNNDNNINVNNSLDDSQKIIKLKNILSDLDKQIQSKQQELNSLGFFNKLTKGAIIKNELQELNIKKDAYNNQLKKLEKGSQQTTVTI